MAQQRFIGYVTQGKRREVWCDNNTSNLLKQTQCRLDMRLIRVTTIRVFYRLI